MFLRAMRRATTLALLSLLALPLAAAAETWTNVSIVDTSCLAKVKDDPDKHTKACALQCAKSGYGLLTPEGKYLKFDAAGNEKTAAALKASKRDDRLRGVVVGERDGETIKVTSVAID